VESLWLLEMLLKFWTAISIAVFSSFPVRELPSMIAPILVTVFVLAAASTPLERMRRKLMSTDKRKQCFRTLLTGIRGQVLSWEFTLVNKLVLFILLYEVLILKVLESL